MVEMPCAALQANLPTQDMNRPPPLWQLVAALFPTIVALFVCSSRTPTFTTLDLTSSVGHYWAPSSHSAASDSTTCLCDGPGVYSHGARGQRVARFFSSPAQYDQEDASGAEFSTGAYTPGACGAYRLEDTGPYGLRAGESYELRETEEGINRIPARVDTQDPTRPMFVQSDAARAVRR